MTKPKIVIRKKIKTIKVGNRKFKVRAYKIKGNKRKIIYGAKF